MTQALSALLAKLEAATGPSRELDAQIAVATGVSPHRMLQSALTCGCSPRYTASLDAAMGLVPDGYGWSVSTPWRDKAKARACVADNARGYFDAEAEMHYGGHDAETPALALCIAALRARLAGQKEHP